MTFDAQPKRKVPSGNDMAQVSAIATAWGLKLRLADGPKSAKFGLKLSRTRGLGAAGKDGKLTLDARENLLHNHQSASSLECCDFEQIQPTHAPLGWRRSNDGGGHSNFIAPERLSARHCLHPRGSVGRRHILPPPAETSERIIALMAARGGIRTRQTSDGYRKGAA